MTLRWRRPACALRWAIGLLSACLLSACAPQFGVQRTEVRTPALNSSYFEAADGTRLPLRTYAGGPHPKAIVIALHGFNDHSGFIDEAARHYASQGIHTVAYDQRGFGAAPGRGEWAGEAALVDDLLTMAALTRQQYPDVPLYVLGESMGAAVAAVALADAPATRVDGVILSAPAVWSRDFMPWYQRLALAVAARIAPTMTLSGKGVRITPSDNLEMRIALARDPLVIKETRIDGLYGLTDLMDRARSAVTRLRHRTLILYGIRDEVIPKKPLIGLLESMPAQQGPQHFRFALYPNGYHMLQRDLQRAVVWDDVVTWALHADRPLPSRVERSRDDALTELRQLAAKL